MAEDVALSGLAFFQGEEVALGNVSHVDEVEAGFDVGGHFATEEAQDDVACGSRFDVVGADGGGGVNDDDVLPGLGGLDGFLLGPVFGFFVVADEAFGEGLVLLGAEAAVAGDADRGHGAGVNGAFNPGFLGGGEDVAGAEDVGSVELGAIALPQGVMRGDVEAVAAALHFVGEVGVGEVASDDFEVLALVDQFTQVGEVAAGAG